MSFESLQLIALTPALEKMAQKKIDAGLYNNISEVVRDAMRAMLEQDRNKALGRLQDS